MTHRIELDELTCPLCKKSGLRRADEDTVICDDPSHPTTLFEVMNLVSPLRWRYSMLPGAIFTYLEQYARCEARHEPGDFLFAFLSGDLFVAIAHADSVSKETFMEIADFCFMEIPTSAYKSPKRVIEWIGRANDRHVYAATGSGGGA